MSESLSAQDPHNLDAEEDAKKKKKAKKEGFTFTDDGCRTELRVGALLILAAVFLWLWLGPPTSMKLFLAGVPLLIIGVPLQAFQALKGRPGFPWKLGLTLAFGGLAMLPDLTYRESIDGGLRVQQIGPMLVLAGVWILAWWPLAHIGFKKAELAAHG